MFLEIWMIVVIVVVSGLWGEYRARMGWYNGKEEAIKRYQFIIQDAMNHDFQKEREKGAANCLVALIHLGMIRIDNDGSIHSFDKTVTYEEAKKLKENGWTVK